jgi:hypothetical protein
MLPDASLSLGRRVVNKWNHWLPGNRLSLCSSLALPLLCTEVRGERVPKQTSAEATDGKLVST